MSSVIVSLGAETETRLRQKAADEGRSLEVLIADLAEREANRNGSAQQLQIVSLDQIKHAGVAYRFCQPLRIEVELDDGYWTLHNESLNLLGSGESLPDALEDFNENFAYLWTEIASDADENLDARAQEIKKVLRDLVVGDNQS